MHILELLRDAPLDIFEGEVTSCWVSGFDDVEEMGVGVVVEESEGGGSTPGINPF